MIKHKDFRLLIAAGGTGGHIFPALSVAKHIIQGGGIVHWVGSKQGMESKIIPNNKLSISYIWVWGVRGKSITTRLFSPIKILIAILQSIFIIIKFKPHVILGMGGFVSGPVGIAAWLCRKPLIIHEQNAVVGFTNKVLVNFSKKVLYGFPDSFKNQPNCNKNKKFIFTGNPVRQELNFTKEQIIKKNNTFLHNSQINILVVGGSRGAKTFNNLLPEVFKSLILKNPNYSINIHHQTGEHDYENTNIRYNNLQNINTKNIKISKFIADMQEAYLWTDLVICRSGALTVAEIITCGLASILVPFPYAVDDHQRKNAQYLVKNNAGILLHHNDFTLDNSLKILSDLLKSKNKIINLANQAFSLKQANVINNIVQNILI